MRTNDGLRNTETQLFLGTVEQYREVPEGEVRQLKGQIMKNPAWHPKLPESDP